MGLGTDSAGAVYRLRKNNVRLESGEACSWALC